MRDKAIVGSCAKKLVAFGGKASIRLGPRQLLDNIVEYDAMVNIAELETVTDVSVPIPKFPLASKMIRNNTA